MKLIDYIKKRYSIKGEFPKGSMKKFADTLGMSMQQLNNMLSSDRFIVSDKAIWREGIDTIIVEKDTYYIKTQDLPK